MAKTVTFKIGQYLLLMVALLAIGAAGGILGAALHWHIRGAVILALPAEIVGLAAFLVLAVWKMVEGRQPGKPLGY